MVDKIIEIVENHFAEDPAFADCFVVDVKQTNTKLDVFIDSDSSMTFEKCQKTSRIVEAYLDEEQPLGEKYTLNVSSPGVDRPLKFKRQYVKNKGRTLEVTTNEGEVIAATDLIQPGHTTTLAVDLQPGTYQVSCRIVAENDEGQLIDHYELGMRHTVNVTVNS